MVSRLKPEAAVAVENTLLVITFIFLLLRLYVRSWLQSRYDVSDALITAAFLLFCVGNAIDGLNYTRGFWDKEIIFHGHSGAPDMKPLFQDDGKLKSILMSLYVWSLPFCTALWFIKFSFLRVYYNIIPKDNDKFKLRLALHISTLFTLVSWFIALCINLFYCLPVNKNWEVVGSQACYSMFSASPYFVTVALHLISDFMLYAIAVSLWSTLRAFAPVSSLLAIFALGALSIIISIGRIGRSGGAYTMTSLAAWTATEQACAIILACSPPLKWISTTTFFAARGTLAEPRNNQPSISAADMEKRIGGGLSIPGVDDKISDISSYWGKSCSNGSTPPKPTSSDPAIMSVRSERVLSVEEFERRRTRELLEREMKERQRVEQERFLERASWNGATFYGSSSEGTSGMKTPRTPRAMGFEDLDDHDI